VHENDARRVVEYIRGFPQPNKIGPIVINGQNGKVLIKPNPARWTQLERALKADNGHCNVEVQRQDGTLLQAFHTSTKVDQPPAPAPSSAPPPAMAAGAPPPPRPAPAPWAALPLPGAAPVAMSSELYAVAVLFDMQARASHVYREDVLREQRELLAQVQGILALPLEALARVNDAQAERISGLERMVSELLRNFGRPITVGAPAKPEPEPTEAPTMGSKVGKVLGDIATGAMLQLGQNLAGEKETPDEQETAK